MGRETPLARKGPSSMMNQVKAVAKVMAALANEPVDLDLTSIKLSARFVPAKEFGGHTLPEKWLVTFQTLTKVATNATKYNPSPKYTLSGEHLYFTLGSPVGSENWEIIEGMDRFRAIYYMHYSHLLDNQEA